MIEATVKSSFVLSKVAKMLSYFSPITIILATMIAGAIYVYNKRRARLVKLIEKIPGPASMPLIGNSLHINVDHDGERLCKWMSFRNQKKTGENICRSRIAFRQRFRFKMLINSNMWKKVNSESGLCAEKHFLCHLS